MEGGPTPAGEENLLTRVTHNDYPSGGHVTSSRKKKNILQPVLLTSFSPSKRKLSNPEVFNMESPSKKRRVNDLIGFWENNHTAKQTGPSQGSRGGKDCGQLPGGLEVDEGHGQPDQCAGSR